MGIRATIQDVGKTPESSLGRGHPGGGLSPWGAAQGEEDRDSARGEGPPLPPGHAQPFPGSSAFGHGAEKSFRPKPGLSRDLERDPQDLAQTCFFPPAPSALPLSFPSGNQGPGPASVSLACLPS